MTNLLSAFLPKIVLIFDFLLLFALVALIFKNSWGRQVTKWIGHHSLWLGLLLGLAAVLGSLFYSNVIGFPPCDLCWWQRVFIYPALPLFAVALYKKDRGVFKFVTTLSLLAIIVSLYNIYIQYGGDPLIPCSAASDCTKVYVDAFGFITIPFMALTTSVTLLLLAWANKIYENDSYTQ